MTQQPPPVTEAASTEPPITEPAITEPAGTESAGPSPGESPRQLLMQAAERARLAPSVHNTQPWRFRLHDEVLDIYRDPVRQLRVVDPAGRQLMISCGCALFNARVALAAAGHEAVLLDVPDEPELLARIAVGSPAGGWLPIGSLDGWIPRRRSNRRQYLGDPVPAELSYTLVQAAAAEGARLIELAALADRALVSRLTKQADTEQLLKPAYRAEIRAWTTDDPRRPDGVQAMSVPRVSGEEADELPIRDFDSRGMGWLPSRTRSSASQCLFLLASAEDEPSSWLRTGQALERLWLEATRHGYAVSLFTQAVEHPTYRQQLRSLLMLSDHPQLVLRVGRAPATPASRRRELAQLLMD
jgi:Nitroreductase family